MKVIWLFLMTILATTFNRIYHQHYYYDYNTRQQCTVYSLVYDNTRACGLELAIQFFMFEAFIGNKTCKHSDFPFTGNDLSQCDNPSAIQLHSFYFSLNYAFKAPNNDDLMIL